MIQWLRRQSTMAGQRTMTEQETWLEAFKSHWQQSAMVISATGADEDDGIGLIIMPDNVVTVFSHLDQMIHLLVTEVSMSNEDPSLGFIMDYMFTEDILNKIMDWSLAAGAYKESCTLNLLKLFECLIAQTNHSLLVHKPVLHPLLRLLEASSRSPPAEVERHLVLLLNQICVSISQESTLLEFFFNQVSEDGPPKFTAFTLLIPYLYHEGNIGQLARDALLLILSVSRKAESVGLFIAEYSNFCPVLATGLSGLFSMLPRKLTSTSDDWHKIGQLNLEESAELAQFHSSLEFINAVIQVSHPLVQKQLLDYVYQGFLVPVVGPALHQPSLDEVISSTAYLQLFLETVTEPTLMKAIVRFLLTESVDQVPILESLVARISSNSRLCLVSLSLFHALLDLNCEDLMYELVFKYLVPCTHIMVSQTRALRDSDLYGKASEKFINLVPKCCSVSEEDGVMASALSMSASDSNSSLASSGDHNLLDSQSGSLTSHKLWPSSSMVDSGFLSQSGTPMSLSAVNQSLTLSTGSVVNGVGSSASSSSTTIHEEDGNVCNPCDTNTGSGNDVTADDQCVMTECCQSRPLTRFPALDVNHYGSNSSLPCVPQQFVQSYISYLRDVRWRVHRCVRAVQCWTLPYDGVDPDPVYFRLDPVDDVGPVTDGGGDRFLGDATTAAGGYESDSALIQPSGYYFGRPSGNALVKSRPTSMSFNMDSLSAQREQATLTRTVAQLNAHRLAPIIGSMIRVSSQTSLSNKQRSVSNRLAPIGGSLLYGRDGGFLLESSFQRNIHSSVIDSPRSAGSEDDCYSATLNHKGSISLANGGLVKAETEPRSVSTTNSSSSAADSTFRREAPFRKSHTNTYFGGKHLSALNANPAFGALHGISAMELTLGPDDFMTALEGLETVQLKDGGRLHGLGSSSSSGEAGGAGGTSSSGSTPVRRRRPGQMPPPNDYLKLTFDEDAASTVFSGSVSETEDSDAGGAGGSSSGTSTSTSGNPWVLIGWSHVTEAEAFVDVLARVRTSTKASQAHVDDNIDYIGQIFESRVQNENNSIDDGHTSPPLDENWESPERQMAKRSESGANGTPDSKPAVGSTGSAGSDDPAVSTISRPIFRSSFRKPSLGPFLEVLLHKLEHMINNSLFVNLHLTRVVARLACYPQPLISSFLLNPNLVFQPTVSSLFQILSSVRHKIDSWAMTVEGWDSLFVGGRKYLLNREKRDADEKRERSLVFSKRNSRWDAEPKIPLHRGTSKPRSFTIFGTQVTVLSHGNQPGSERDRAVSAAGMGNSSNKTFRFSKASNNSFNGSSRSLATSSGTSNALDLMKTKNVVYSAIVLEEFLKEMAAIAQEHAVSRPEIETSLFLRRL